MVIFFIFLSVSVVLSMCLSISFIMNSFVDPVKNKSVEHLILVLRSPGPGVEASLLFPHLAPVGSTPTRSFSSSLSVVLRNANQRKFHSKTICHQYMETRSKSDMAGLVLTRAFK